MGTQLPRRFALVATVCLALAGCSPVSTAPLAQSPSGTPQQGSPSGGAGQPADTSGQPGAALAAAVAKTAATSCRLRLGDADGHGTGVYDAASKGASYVLNVDDGSTVTLLAFGIDVYVIGLADSSGQVLHFDVTKFDPNSSLLSIADPMLALRLLGTASGVERTAKGFRGTLDLARINPADHPADKVIADSLIKDMGGRSNGIAFEAEVDGQGLLTRFTSTLPGADAGRDIEYELILSEFGTTDKVTKPTGPDVIEASPELYRD